MPRCSPVQRLPAAAFRRGLRLIAALLGLGTALPAAPQHERALATLAPGARALLAGLDTLSPEELARLDALADPVALERDTRAILALGSLNVAARDTGADGRAALHRYLVQRLESLSAHGLELTGSLRGQVPAPVSLDRLLDRTRREPPATLEVGGETFRLHPLWANGPHPSLAPSAGLTGRLVDAGDAAWERLDGLDLMGSIALMDFRGARNWERLFSLGVQAVIVVEDDYVSRDTAERLFAHTPVPCPRYYVDREEGERLRRLLRASAGTGHATLRGGALFENRPWETFFAYLQPTPETTHTVAPGEWLQSIAADYGLTGPQLAEEAGLPDPSAELRPGQSFRLPGGRPPYVVRPGELWTRLAARYGLPAEAFRAANPHAPENPPAGTVLTVPNVADTLVVIVPIDSMSVVPDAAHGALRAANLAAALRFVDHLARESSAPRRKGVMFVFQDADTLGGVSSRTFARYALLALERFTPLPHLESRDQVARLEGALAFFNAPNERTAEDALRLLPPEQVAWLAQTWLPARVEEQRVARAEARIAALAARERLASDATAAAFTEADAALAAAAESLRALVALRDQTLGAGRNGGAPELLAFRRALHGPAAGVAANLGLAWERLQARLAREHAEAAFQQTSHAHNLATARAVLTRLHPGRAPGDTAPRLGWFLDLTDGSDTLGLTHLRAVDYRVIHPASVNPGTARSIETRFGQLAAAAALRAGWTQEWLFAADADRREFPQLPVVTPPAYPDLWTAADVALLTLGTLNDRLQRLDTPHDVPARLRFTALGTVARTAFVLLQAGLERPAESLAPARLPRPRFGALSGRALQFNLRSGIDAQDPVAGAAVYYPAVKQVEAIDAHNTSTHRGYRRGVMQLTNVDGVFHLPPESTAFRPLNHIYAYHFDRDTAVFDRILNHGQVGTRPQELTFALQPDREVEKNLVMAAVTPLALFAENDPYMHRPIGGERERKIRQNFRLTDARLQGEPRHFAIENPALHFNERDLATTILYAPAGRSLRAAVHERTLVKLLLTGPLGDDGLGRGYRLGPDEDGSSRNLALPVTPLVTARDFLASARFRLEQFRSHGITSRTIEETVARAAAKVDEADAAVASRDWVTAHGAAREAWGMLIKVYPRILGLGREAVFSVIVLMGLLLPACVFLERLLLGGRGIVRHLVGVAGLFLAGTLFLNAFHPAFKIAVSPFIVVIAFTMILMSGLVLVVCYQRFEVLLRRAREQGGEIEDVSPGLVATLQTALSLGVANLRKRPARTALTTFTVAVLTFSIVSFVSISGRDTLRFRSHALDPDIEGRLVEPEPPAYEGVLFRKFNWFDYGTQEIATLRSEFSGAHETTTRGFYLETEGGSAADREGVNQIPVTHGGRSAIQTGVMTFEPNEPRFSGLHRAVTNETWFREDDRFHAIIPDTLAADLGIGPDDVADPSGARRPDHDLPALRFLNHTWRVIGILDTKRADRLRDVNGKSLALVDHLRSAMTRNATGESILNEAPSVHLGWARLLITPQRAAEDINAKPRAVAVKLGSGTDAARFLDDLALRLNQAFFVHANGRLGMLSPTERTSVAGIAKIVVPVFLCVLIVLNTMMGTVDERRGEVGMLGAVGLSPRQISFLLLSESLVFSILGIVLGLFAGLGLANAVPWLDARGFDALAGVSFNFTSFASIGLALGTGGVVLLATLIPARRAAALAAPSGMEAWRLPPPGPDGRIEFVLPFTLTRDNSAGMIAFFRQFLHHHAEPTSADFNCRHVRVVSREGAGTTIACTLWLAPYDLDVAQDFALRIAPSETPGIDRVTLLLERKSGTEEAWLRTTYAFLNRVRQQFLLWRNLTPELRARHVRSGLELTADRRN